MCPNISMCLIFDDKSSEEKIDFTQICFTTKLEKNVHLDDTVQSHHIYSQRKGLWTFLVSTYLGI